MTKSISKELAEKVAVELATLGFTLFKGLVYQIAPDYRPENGSLLQGTAAFPFVSLTFVLPETFIIEESFNSSSAMNRPMSVALIADKAIVQIDPDPYAKYRQDAMRIIHMNRFRGEFTSDPNSCMFHATVRPGSPIQQSSWLQYTKFVSSFDILFRTDEANTVT